MDYRCRHLPAWSSNLHTYTYICGLADYVHTCTGVPEAGAGGASTVLNMERHATYRSRERT